MYGDSLDKTLYFLIWVKKFDNVRHLNILDGNIFNTYSELEWDL